VLELTEGVLVRDEREVLDRLHQLHACGARIAIDDFGVGYSSLGYVQRLPIDIVKIDKSFIDNLGDGNPKGGALARAVVSFSQALELEVVAEGIERADQRDELLALGCGFGQGYLYSPPMPPADLERILLGRASLGPPGPGGGNRLTRPNPPRPRNTAESSALR
jgi:EAL domain-containing protein (putative c-di-GMP-specific phosphodiesterase class I)